MSNITDVLIVTIDGETGAVAYLNGWLEEHDPRKQQLAELDAEKAGAGGTKACSMVLYAAAFNYLRIGEFVDAIRSAPWKCPHFVAVYINPEDAYTFLVSPSRDDKWELPWGDPAIVRVVPQRPVNARTVPGS